MKKTSTTNVLRLSLAALAIAGVQTAQAAWEQVWAHPTTQAHIITSKGTFLISDYDDNRKGGIFFSEDKGKTWKQTEVKDFNYHKFYEADGYVYALGTSARIARSSDDGRTWEILNYSKTLEGVVDDKALQSLETYSMVKAGDKLYIADFAGGGVLMSSDNGETWELTDRESLFINVKDVGMMIDSFYNLEFFKGHVYAFGMLSVHRYDPSADRWEAVNINSNFMAVSTVFDGCMVCGRSVTNFDPTGDYLVWTEDGYNWDGIMAPEARTDYGTSLNIRAIHSDKKYIYTVGPEGFIPNPDGDVPPFVMAPDFYYTSDFGDTWNYVGGLPVGTYPLTLTSDDDYVYTAVYSPIPSNEQSGLWRLPKSDITNAGIEAVESGAEAEVRFADGMLEVSAVADRIIVYGLDGKPVSMAEGVSVLDVNSLDKGVYTYEIRVEGRRIAGNSSYDSAYEQP